MATSTLGFLAKITLLLLTAPHLSSAQMEGSVFPLAVAGVVAGVLFVVLVSTCAILIFSHFEKNRRQFPKESSMFTKFLSPAETYRRCSRDKKSASKPNVLTVVGDEMESSSTLQSRVYSNASSNRGTGNKADYWSNAERRGQQTEEKVRRMNIADNFEELGRNAPPHAPPPPILRSVGFAIKEQAATTASGVLVTDESHRRRPQTVRDSALSADIIYHNPNPPEPMDPADEPQDHEHQPSTSYNPEPEFAPIILGRDEQDVAEAGPSGTQTPNPQNFQPPDEDGFYRLQVE